MVEDKLAFFEVGDRLVGRFHRYSRITILKVGTAGVIYKFDNSYSEEDYYTTSVGGVSRNMTFEGMHWYD